MTDALHAEGFKAQEVAESIGIHDWVRPTAGARDGVKQERERVRREFL